MSIPLGPRIKHTDDNDFVFFCLGCDWPHVIDNRWSFNGSLTTPTFGPSYLARSFQGPERIEQVCHSFIRDGYIEYLGDCTHKLAGTTILLPEIPNWYPND